MVVIAAASLLAAAKEHYISLDEHYQEHQRIQVIPSLGEARTSDDCPECLLFLRAKGAHARNGDDAMQAVLLEMFVP